MNDVAAIVMAGGAGTRMNSGLPKVLHRIGSEPMLFHTLNNLLQTGIEDIYLVVGYKSGLVEEAVKPRFKVIFARQTQLLGTADAVKQALTKFTQTYKTVMIVGGDDSAFYTPSTLKEFALSHSNNQADISVMTSIDPDRQKMGKIFRDQDGQFDRILEYDDYTRLQLTGDEINCGVYLFEMEWLKKNISLVEKNPVKGEYYLTELLNMAKKQAKKVNIFMLKNRNEWFGINTPEELDQANRLWEDLNK